MKKQFMYTYASLFKRAVADSLLLFPAFAQRPNLQMFCLMLYPETKHRLPFVIQISTYLKIASISLLCLCLYVLAVTHCWFLKDYTFFFAHLSPFRCFIGILLLVTGNYLLHWYLTWAGLDTERSLLLSSFKHLQFRWCDKRSCHCSC